MDQSQSSWWIVDGDGQQAGPLTQHQVLDMMRQGEIGRDTLVWQHGMSEWAEAASPAHLQFSAAVAASTSNGSNSQA